MLFYVGTDSPSHAKHLELVFISVNRLRKRKSLLTARHWIMDSGAFTELSTHGRYRHGVDDYAKIINRFARDPGLVAAVAQDYMCEPWIVKKTGLSVAEHHRLTIERYDALVPAVPHVYIMPVLQGYTPEEYVSHIHQYGDRLTPGMYVGVGSICKRNGDPSAIEAILIAIKHERPDLNLHGFGLKTTALASCVVRECLYSADSMSWSFAARYEGRDHHDWREAKAFADQINEQNTHNYQYAFVFGR